MSHVRRLPFRWLASLQFIGSVVFRFLAYPIECFLGSGFPPFIKHGTQGNISCFGCCSSALPPAFVPEPIALYLLCPMGLAGDDGQDPGYNPCFVVSQFLGCAVDEKDIGLK